MVNFFTPNEENIREAKLRMHHIEPWHFDILADSTPTVLIFSDCYSEEEKEAFSKWLVSDIYPIPLNKFPTNF